MTSIYPAIEIITTGIVTRGVANKGATSFRNHVLQYCSIWGGWVERRSEGERRKVLEGSRIRTKE